MALASPPTTGLPAIALLLMILMVSAYQVRAKRSSGHQARLPSALPAVPPPSGRLKTLISDLALRSVPVRAYRPQRLTTPRPTAPLAHL